MPAVAITPSRPAPRGLGTGAQPGLDHPDDRDVEPFLERVERGGGSVVASDHERLHIAFEQEVGDVERVLQHNIERFRTIRKVTCVTEVDHLLVRQQVDEGAEHGEPAEPGVEHTDRSGTHESRAPAARRRRSATAAPIPTSGGGTASTTSSSAASAARSIA